MTTCDVVLHPTDFSEEADQAFHFACAIARDQFATLVVMHVVPPSFKADCEVDQSTYPVPEIQKCWDEFRRMKSLEMDVPIRFRVVAGYPVGMILNVACEEDADLIVMTSSHREKARLQLHGTVAEGVLRQAHCPVFCLKLPLMRLTRDAVASRTNPKKRRQANSNPAASPSDE